MVKTKSGELQTPGNNIERGGGGGGGGKYYLPACKPRHSRKMYDICLFQLLLSMIVAFKDSLCLQVCVWNRCFEVGEFLEHVSRLNIVLTLTLLKLCIHKHFDETFNGTHPG